jgi:hypothetical protein
MANRIIYLKSLVIGISLLFSCNSGKEEVVESISIEETKEVSAPQASSEDEIIHSTLNNFYTEYLSQIDKFPVNEDKLKAIKSDFCSVRLLQKLDTMELDYDPFTNSQDFDSNTANKVNIAKKSDLTYTVSLSNNSEYTTTLFLIKKENKYYIDSILDLY